MTAIQSAQIAINESILLGIQDLESIGFSTYGSKPTIQFYCKAPEIFENWDKNERNNYIVYSHSDFITEFIFL